MSPEQWPRVKDVFHDALEQPAEERGAFLARACGTDVALRAEVERLLNAHEHAGGFIEQSPISLPPSLSGRVLGRYEVGRLIGSGGMGEVYAARDTELGREVALKIGSETDLAAEAGLRREAQHASKLNHPHICTIHEVGVEDGQAFIAMEYVEGSRLSDTIPSGGFEGDRVLRYGIQIADGLDHAHRKGVTHRDLKSENIVITPDGRAKILDFGLARPIGAGRIQEISESNASVEAQPGLLAGTLSAMAPELLRGEPADECSDIWALGILLYEMAAGRRPFTGATGFQLSGAILHQPPPPLPARVSMPLQAIIRRCLSKDPRERYRYAGEVRSALEAIQLPSPTWKAGLRSRRVTVGAMGFLIAVIAGATVIWQRAQPAEASLAIGPAGRPAIAVMQFENVIGTPDTAWMSRGVPNMLLTGLAQTRGLDLVSPQRLHEIARQTGRQSLESLDQTQSVDVARRAGAGAIVRGTIVKAGSDIRIDAQLEDLSTGRVLAADSVRGTDVFALVDQLAARIRNGVGLSHSGSIRHVADVSTSSLEAYRYYSEGVTAYNNTRVADAKVLFEKAVAIDPTFAEAHFHLALLCTQTGQRVDAGRYLAKAAEHTDRLNERQQLLLKAEIARAAGNYAAATKALDEVIAKYPDLEEAYAVACRVYQPVVGAVPDARKHIGLLEAGLSALPTSTLLRNLYGYALLYVGRHEEAIRTFEAYAAAARREPNPQDSLGEAHLLAGSPDKALEHFSRALTIDSRFYPSHTGRAWALGMLGRYDEGLRETPVPGFVRAFMLSRVGRYREAEQLMASEIHRADGNKNVFDEGAFRLLFLVLALERSQVSPLVDDRLAEVQRFASEHFQSKTHLGSVVAQTIVGLGEIRAGRIEKAHALLELQRRAVRRDVKPEQWWHKLLESEIALAEGDPKKASAAFAAGKPEGKMWLQLTMPHLSLLANSLRFRDAGARAAKARGDLQVAIDTYRDLLTVGPKQTWTAMFEPRYVLEIARLKDTQGDKKGALIEYRRFLDFWKAADSDLPEVAEARAAIERLR